MGGNYFVVLAGIIPLSASFKTGPSRLRLDLQLDFAAGRVDSQSAAALCSFSPSSLMQQPSIKGFGLSLSLTHTHRHRLSSSLFHFLESQSLFFAATKDYGWERSREEASTPYLRHKQNHGITIVTTTTPTLFKMNRCEARF